MRVIIITRQPFPNGMAGTNRIKCYARALHYAGVECEILVFSRDGINHSAKGEIDGVPFSYLLGFSKRWTGYLGKIQTILMMAGLYVHLLFKLHKGDIVFEYARESYKFINIVIKLTHFKRAKFVSELCEIPGLGFKHNAALQENVYIENTLFPQYDGVIAISSNLAEYAHEHGSERCKVLKVPALVDVQAFSVMAGPKDIEYPYIFYSGSFDDQKDGTIVMFDAFKIVANTVKTPVKFVCTGTKDAALQVGYLTESINDPKLNASLVFTGYLNQTAIATYLYGCEMVISSRYTNEQTTNGFSTKLAEYAAAGKAIVMTPVGEASSWFHNSEDCLQVPEHDAPVLAQAILSLLDDETERNRLGKEAKKMSLKSFDYKVWGKPMKLFFESL